jgi:hypothetical protein
MISPRSMETATRRTKELFEFCWNICIHFEDTMQASALSMEF